MTKTKSDAKAPVTHHSVTLDDLNDDPTLVDGLSKENVKRLHNEAEKGQVPLGGSVRQRLNSLFNEHYPPED
jgi:hypothetical protein